jgi:Flp pilus assembly protein TadG
MRRLNRLLEEERGATAVMVGLLMVPLIGFAAIGVDAGSLYWEDAQLQNGADAGALAVATHCAHPAVDPTATSSTIASNLTAANDIAAPDGTTVIFSGGAECAGGQVTVKATRTNASHPLAAALGIGATAVNTQATAVWGSPTSSTITLPIAISYCEFQKSTLSANGPIQLLKLNNPGSGQPNAGCAGTTYPGGFGWLSNSVCALNVTIGWNDAVPGKSYPGACDQTFSVIKGQTVLVPIYNNAQGSGSNGQFYVFGFAAFTVTGWTFTGNNNSPDPNGPSCTGSCNGIWGRFINFTFSDTDTTQYGGPGNLGTTVVQLVKDWS